jgi:hypothetical protein
MPKSRHIAHARVKRGSRRPVPGWTESPRLPRDRRAGAITALAATAAPARARTAEVFRTTTNQPAATARGPTPNQKHN